MRAVLIARSRIPWNVRGDLCVGSASYCSRAGRRRASDNRAERNARNARSGSAMRLFHLGLNRNGSPKPALCRRRRVGPRLPSQCMTGVLRPFAIVAQWKRFTQPARFRPVLRRHIDLQRNNASRRSTVWRHGSGMSATRRKKRRPTRAHPTSSRCRCARVR